MKNFKKTQKLSNEDLDFYGLTFKCKLEDRDSLLNFLRHQLLYRPYEAEEADNNLPYEIFRRAINGEFEVLTKEDISQIKTLPSLFITMCEKPNYLRDGVYLDDYPTNIINPFKNLTKEQVNDLMDERARKSAIAEKARMHRERNKNLK